MTEKEKKVFVGRIEVYDKYREQKAGNSYGGEIGLAAIAAPTIEQAITNIMIDIGATDVDIVSIDSFCSAEHYEDDTTSFGVTIEELTMEAKRSGKVIYSSVVCYSV